MGDFRLLGIAVLSRLRSDIGPTVVYGGAAQAAVSNLSGGPSAAPTPASSSGASIGCGQSRESRNRHRQWAATDAWKDPGESSDD